MVDVNGRFCLDAFEQNTGSAVTDDDRWFFCGKFLFKNFVAFRKVIRVNNFDTVYAECAAKALQRSTFAAGSPFIL